MQVDHHMAEMPLISIIVPVYNVERYLPKCINSVLNQSVSDWELILVNDGSIDSSLQVCREYEQKDNRIKVIDQANQGVSVARNLGLEKSRGLWVCFLDADDWLGENTLELCNVYPDVDIIRFSMEYIYAEDNSKSSTYILRNYNSRIEYLSDVVARRTLLGVCAGFYKRNIFNKYKIKFEKDIKLGEDWIVLAEFVSRAQSVVTVGTPYYKYNKYNSSSCTSILNSTQLASLVLAYKKLKSVVSECNYVCIEQSLRYSGVKVAYQVLLSKSLDSALYNHLKKEIKLSFIDICSSELSIKQKMLLTIALLPFGLRIIRRMIA